MTYLVALPHALRVLYGGGPPRPGRDASRGGSRSQTSSGGCGRLTLQNYTNNSCSAVKLAAFECLNRLKKTFVRVRGILFHSLNSETRSPSKSTHTHRCSKFVQTNRHWACGFCLLSRFFCFFLSNLICSVVNVGLQAATCRQTEAR